MTLSFLKHPDFCRFLESSGLQSQIKITRDVLVEVDGQATLLVEGKIMAWPTIQEKFEAVYSKRYRETFLIDKQTRTTYTYLDNGKGLQPHHPFLTEATPLSQINDEEYNKVLASAQTFVREDEANLSADERNERNKNRTFIFQLVTSHTQGPNTNLHQLLTRSRHPYLRVIVGEDNPALQTKKGEVYEVGYGWQSKVAIPLIATQGQFRSPDLWEYQNCEERIVTNIAVSKLEANALYNFTLKYHRDGVNLGNATGFHLLHQNCSTYIRSALQVAGITVPTEISLTDLIKKVAPDWMHAIGRGYVAARQNIAQKINRVASWIVPKCVNSGIAHVAEKISSVCSKVLKAIAAFTLTPVKAALGGWLGKGGAAFVPINAPARRIEPEIANWKTWFKLSYYRFNLPGILQEWQRAQPSTVVYHKPVKLSIVP